MSRTQQMKGYERKKSRLRRENSTMSELFSNYQRFNGVRLDHHLLENFEERSHLEIVKTVFIIEKYLIR